MKLPLRSAALGTLMVPGIDSLRLPGPLIVREEENPIAAHGAADGPAKLVLAEGSAGRRKIVARVEIGIAQEVEGVAMEPIAAGLGDDIDLAAAELSILCIEVAGNDAKLIDAIEVRDNSGAGR